MELQRGEYFRRPGLDRGRLHLAIVVARLLVNRRAEQGLQHHAHHAAPWPRCSDHRRPAGIVARLQPRSCTKQRVDDLRGPWILCCSHQRGSAPFVVRVHPGTCGEQLLHDRRIPGLPRRRHERRPAVFGGCAHFGPGLQQRLQHRLVGVVGRGGHQHRRAGRATAAEFRHDSRVRVRSSRDQGADHLRIAVQAGRQYQGSNPAVVVGGIGVHVRPGVDEHLQDRRVLVVCSREQEGRLTAAQRRVLMLLGQDRYQGDRLPIFGIGMNASKGGRFVGVERFQLGPGFEQRPDDAGVRVQRGGPHQRRPATIVASIQPGGGVHQRPQHPSRLGIKLRRVHCNTLPAATDAIDTCGVVE